MHPIATMDLAQQSYRIAKFHSFLALFFLKSIVKDSRPKFVSRVEESNPRQNIHDGVPSTFIGPVPRMRHCRDVVLPK